MPTFNSYEKSKSKNNLVRNIFLFLLLLILIGAGVLYYFYRQNFETIPASSPSGFYTLNIEQGEGTEAIATKLEEDLLISSKDAFIFREQFQTPLNNNIQPGSYVLEVPASQTAILEQINNQSNQKLLAVQNQANKPTVQITFKEGETIDDYAAKLESESILSANQFKSFAQDSANFSQTKFPFLPEPLDCEYGNLKTCAKYYPEGYLYPDTYEFFVPSTPEDVYAKLLTNFNQKVYSPLKEDIGSQNFHKSIILASVLEKETGRTRGIKAEDLETVNKERAIMAGVFENRTKIGMKWRSDVTAEYGHGRKLCQQTFEVPNCIYLNDPLAQTLYNTYNVDGYPIAPVTNPQFYNVRAALNPTPNNNIYFVSDAIGRKYFSETEAQFNQSIEDVTQINRDLGI